MAETETVETPSVTATSGGAVEVTHPTLTPTDWRAGLTGEMAPLAQEKALESFKGKDWTEVGPSLAKAFVETKKLVGAKPSGVKIPGDGATPEEIAAYRKAIGVPETPEEYAVRLPEMPPGETWDEGARDKFLARLHSVGTPPNVVQAIADWYGQQLNETYAGFRREAEAAGQELRRDWGPNYDANLGRANRAIQQYGGDSLVDLYARTGVGRNPVAVRAWAKVAEDLQEHGAMAGDTIGHVTPEEAQDKVKTLQAELVKVPYGSEAHRSLIDQIVTYSKIAEGRRA